MAENDPEFARPADKLILVVDDEEFVRNLIEATAKREGFQVVTASNGLDGARKVAARAPDLIIADIMMPAQGGYEFLRNLQSTGSQGIPVMVMTGSFLEVSTIDMIRQEANVVEFISKPIELVKFVAKLHKHLKTAPPSRA